MAAPRFFVGHALASVGVGREFELPEAAARHAARALRLRIGDRVVVFDGGGGEYGAEISRLERRAVAVTLLEFVPDAPESLHGVTLVASVLAASTMDLVVRQAVELGAAEIVPVIASRSNAPPAGERIERRADRWRQIAIAACEQSGRNRIPPIAIPRAFSAWLEELRSPVPDAIILDPRADDTLLAIARTRPNRHLIVGPEGGFTAEEVDHAQRSGAVRAGLGSGILRAETAACAALAIVTALGHERR